MDRPNRFEMRFSNEEQRLLDRLAETEGVSGSEVVRSLVRREARRVLDWSPVPSRPARSGRS